MDSRHNPAQPEATDQNPKSGQEVAKKKALKRPAAKTHKDFWKERLERRCYSHEGALREVEEWSVRIQHLGKRKSFALGTTNSEVAAVKARDLYLKILAEGWDAAEAAYNPEMIVRKNDPTVGAFLETVEKCSTLKPKTFRNYAGYFRRIVADVFRIEDGQKFDYRSGGTAKWRETVDSVRLAALTPDKVEQWRRSYILASSDSPVARESAVRSSSSYLRCARSLFSRKWLKSVQGRIRLPSPLPFEGVAVSSFRPNRYRSRVDLRKLVMAAKTELPKKSPRAYLIFLLAVGAGLRKGEIDGLEWAQVNFEDATIDVSPNQHRDLKTDSSNAAVMIDFELRDELRRFHSEAASDFVIEASGKSDHRSGRQHYRAEKAFGELYSWLRKQGVQDQKPLHLLRKEFGSQINARFGLYAAMTALRHNNITTTANHYVENAKRIALPLSEFASGLGGQVEVKKRI